MPLKSTHSKCVLDWQLTGEVSTVDMRNGSSLVKFTNVIDYKVIEGQP